MRFSIFAIDSKSSHMQTFTEENYLKAIYHLSNQKEDGLVQTSALAEMMQTRSPTVTDMLKKLADKALVHYTKYQGVRLTESGSQVALKIIRNHRLWEVFLVEKLGFSWDEIHEIAEQLEHIDSDQLIQRLDSFLNYPKFDPHGDPIPDQTGMMPSTTQCKLTVAPLDTPLFLTSVSEDSALFLQHLDKLGLTIGVRIVVLSVNAFDHSLQISINAQPPIFITSLVAQNVWVRAH